MTSNKIYKAPQVDAVLRHHLLGTWREKLEAKALTNLVRQVLADNRQSNLASTDLENPEVVAKQVDRQLKDIFDGGLTTVLNGTGVIINTNLGRAPLPQSILSELTEILQGYCSLEIDLLSGARGDRNAKIERLLGLITGCQGALIVNNNAAAVTLAIATLSSNKEVIVSRGELIEIGGSFRLPDVIEAAGGILKEVGTTNRTRLSDYAHAITNNTGVILKCHQSNFEIRGFVEEVPLSDLAKLSLSKNVALIEDLGSGSVFSLDNFGLPERTVQQSVSQGANLTLFSGDKLFGGPQAGFIVGLKHLTDKLQANVRYRVLRPDKFVIGLIEQILKLYIQKDSQKDLPILQMVSEDILSLKQRVDSFAKRTSNIDGPLLLSAHQSTSTLGGGTSPKFEQASYALAVRSKQSGLTADKLAALFRETIPPVIVRTKGDTVLIDFRTLTAKQEPALDQALRQLARRL